MIFNHINKVIINYSNSKINGWIIMLIGIYIIINVVNI